MLQVILKKALRIEFLLIVTALAIFFCTLYFKSASNAQIQRLDSDMLLVQLDGGKPTGTRTHETPEETVRRMLDDYEPYTYFDKTLSRELDAVCANILGGTRDSESVVAFQNHIHKVQTRLNLGYDALLYCSLFLIAIAVGMITEKFFKKSILVEHLKTAEDEKSAFSRDLHDGVAQNLAALKIYLEKEDLPKSKFYAKQALDEIRYMIGQSRLDFSGDFEKLVAETCRTFEANFGIQTATYFASKKAAALSEGAKAHLMRILQEALSNIARHADASRVEVRLVDTIGELRFIISDNGKGFAFEDVEKQNQSDGAKHYGLLNIKKRAELIGARVDFMTEGGSTIAVTVKDSVHSI